MPSIIPGMWNAAVIIPDTGSRFAIFKQKVEDELKTKITHKKLVAQIVDAPTFENPQILTDEQKKEGLAIIHDVTHQLWAALNILKKASEEAGLPQPRSITVTGGRGRLQVPHPRTQSQQTERRECRILSESILTVITARNDSSLIIWPESWRVII